MFAGYLLCLFAVVFSFRYNHVNTSCRLKFHLPPCVGIGVVDFYSFEIRRPIKASYGHQLTIDHS